MKESSFNKSSKVFLFSWSKFCSIFADKGGIIIGSSFFLDSIGILETFFDNLFLFIFLFFFFESFFFFLFFLKSLFFFFFFFFYFCFFKKFFDFFSYFNKIFFWMDSFNFLIEFFIYNNYSLILHAYGLSIFVLYFLLFLPKFHY